MLYERFYGYALKTVFRYIYQYEHAVDVTNDGFAKFFRHFEKFKPGPPADTEKILMAYLKKIMINTAIDELRKRQMIPEIGAMPDSIWDVVDDRQDAEQHMRYKELILLIKRLAPQYRSVFNLYVIDGYNHNEIAGMLSISAGTSKSCLSRARALLQDSIRKSEKARVCRV